MSLTELGAREAVEALRRTDVNTLTPLEALNLLSQLKKKVEV